MPGAWPSDAVSAPRDRYKRAFDLTALAVAFVALAPLWLLLAVAVPLAMRLVDGGPVLYRQRRLGRHGRPFAMLKFRSMRVSAEAVTGPVWAGQPDARATPLGRLLRRLRLDELPQVVNVLRGEMSLVGPRPERPELVGCCEREAPGFARRLAVLPGIAGLAQARLGSAAGPADKLRCDLIYIGAMGPWLDARLCVASLVRLLREVVAPPRSLSAAHHLGGARARRWEPPFDLEASALVDAAGREQPLAPSDASCTTPRGQAGGPPRRAACSAPPTPGSAIDTLH